MTETPEKPEVPESPENPESSETVEEYLTPDLKACIFSVGGRRFSVDLDYLREIAEVTDIVPLPLSPSYIEGIAHVRGLAVPVMNLAALKGLTEEEGDRRWLIVFEVGRDHFGVTVQEMPDLSEDYGGEYLDIPEMFETYRVR